MSSYLTVTPAYGRDYKTKKEVLEAWEQGKDFAIASVFDGGGYINKEDARPGMTINIRYKRATQIAVVKIK